MKILSVDTSAVCASVAITQDNKVISLCQTNAGLTHSRTLLPMIDAALKNSETKLNDIDFFACSVGPGSFTGIRIGIAAVKGLADGISKKCMPISTLEGLAYNLLGQDVLACAVMDARCSQVYTALFDIREENIVRLTNDDAIKIDELGQQLSRFEAKYNKKVVLVGDGAELCHKLLGYDMAAAVIRYQNAASIGFCAQQQFDESKLMLPKELMPIYLRLPQAQRELKKKQLNEAENK